jgi:hypothetical protein
MARFANPQASEGVAIGTTVDVANYAASAVYTALTADDPTLTAAQVINGIVSLSTQTAAQDVTMPSAAQLIAAMPNCQVGSAFDFVLINKNTSSGAATVVAGAGVTLTGTTTCAVDKSRVYKGIVTDVGTPAVRLVGVQLGDA